MNGALQSLTFMVYSYHLSRHGGNVFILMNEYTKMNAG